MPDAAAAKESIMWVCCCCCCAEKPPANWFCHSTGGMPLPGPEDPFPSIPFSLLSFMSIDLNCPPPQQALMYQPPWQLTLQEVACKLQVILLCNIFTFLPAASDSVSLPAFFLLSCRILREMQKNQRLERIRLQTPQKSQDMDHELRR